MIFPLLLFYFVPFISTSDQEMMLHAQLFPEATDREIQRLSEIPEKKESTAPSSWFSWTLPTHRPLTQEELAKIKEYNKQLEIQLKNREKRIAELEKSNGNDAKQKQD